MHNGHAFDIELSDLFPLCLRVLCSLQARMVGKSSSSSSQALDKQTYGRRSLHMCFLVELDLVTEYRSICIPPSVIIGEMLLLSETDRAEHTCFVFAELNMWRRKSTINEPVRL